MSNRQDNFMSSSPSKMFDQYIDQAFDSTAGTNSSNTLGNQINTPTGLTPYFDRQNNSIGFLNNSVFLRSPQESKNIQQQLLFQQQQQLHQQQQQGSQQASGQQQQTNQSTLLSQSLSQNTLLPPSRSYSGQNFAIYEPGAHNLLASSPQRPNDIFGYQELNPSMATPVAERSFKVSDFFVDTPTLNKYDLDNLLGEVISREDMQNINNLGVLSNFGTPIDKLNKYFKTPLYEYSASKARNNSTTSSSGINSIKRNLNFATTTSSSSNSNTTAAINNNKSNGIIINTPSKDKFTTPLKKGDQQQSSPSTIIIGSTKADAKTIASMQMSPTPINKTSIKAPICQLVKPISSLEPVVGIFQDQGKLPPSFGSVAASKPKGNHNMKQQQKSQSLAYSANNVIDNSSQPLKKRDNENMASGMSKFQIVFTDKNSKGKISKKKKSMDRSITTGSFTNQNNKKKVQRQLSEQRKQQQSQQQPLQQQQQHLQQQHQQPLPMNSLKHSDSSKDSLVRYATDPSFLQFDSSSSPQSQTPLTDITTTSRNNMNINRNYNNNQLPVSSSDISLLKAHNSLDYPSSNSNNVSMKYTDSSFDMQIGSQSVIASQDLDRFASQSQEDRK